MTFPSLVSRLGAAAVTTITTLTGGHWFSQNGLSETRAAGAQMGEDVTSSLFDPSEVEDQAQRHMKRVALEGFWEPLVHEGPPYAPDVLETRREEFEAAYERQSFINQELSHQLRVVTVNFPDPTKAEIALNLLREWGRVIPLYDKSFLFLAADAAEQAGMNRLELGPKLLVYYREAVRVATVEGSKAFEASRRAIERTSDDEGFLRPIEGLDRRVVLQRINHTEVEDDPTTQRLTPDAGLLQRITDAGKAVNDGDVEWVGE
jgi:hypothetical protein